MKKNLFFCFIAFTLLFLIPFHVQAKEPVKIYLFWGDGCPHCSKEKEFLNEIKKEYDNVKVIYYEVWYNDKNANLLNKVREAFDNKGRGVPITIIGTQIFDGFMENTKASIRKAVEYASEHPVRDVVDEIITGKGGNEPVPNEPEDLKEVTIPLLGTIDPRKFSLSLIAIVIGFVDGFNPCAMWVLLFLISMLIGSKSRKRMWGLGLTFIGASAFIYFLFMMAWIQVTMKITSIIWIRSLIGVVAILAAIWNFWRYYKGRKEEAACDIVNDEKRKKTFAKIKKYVNEKSIILSVFGIITLAVSVNLVELACSAGLPVLFTQILEMSNLKTWQYISYVLLYIFFFLIDDMIIFAIAMKTLKVTGISNRYSKFSHVIGGILMLLIGILLLLKPEWLMFG